MLRQILALLLFSQPLLAATGLPPILVSASRSAEQRLDIPAAATVIDRQQIDDSGATDVAELLRRVAGLHVSDALGDGGSARIDMRGFGATAASNVAILINGRKLNPATDSASLYLNAINLDQVEQIEIVHGSAGTLFGNQAVGGLVNVITRRVERPARRLRVGLGSYDGVELAAGLSEPLSDDAGLRVGLLRRTSDNYRDRNASDLKRLELRAEIGHGRGFSSAELQLLDDYVQTPGALLASELDVDRRQAVFSDDFIDTRSRVLRLASQQALSDAWSIEADLTVRDDDRVFRQSFRGFPGSRSTQERETLELAPRLLGRFGTSNVTLGLDYVATDYLLVTAFGAQGNDQSIAAAYAQLTQSLSASTSVTLGVRHARVDNEIDNNGSRVRLDDALTVGSLGLDHHIDDRWRTFVRADQNYRFAKVDEHTNVPFGQPVGLANQRGISFETGVEYRGPRLRFAARAFRLDLRDEISFDAISFTNVNLPRSRRYGLALAADTDVTAAWRLGVAYDFVDSEIRSGTHAGNEVPLVPRQRAQWFVEYRPSADYFARLDVGYTDQQFLGSDFANAAPPLDAYTVVDLAVHHDRGDWRFTAQARNLLNERYSETGSSSFAGDGFNPAPERNFWLGLRYRFED